MDQVSPTLDSVTHFLGEGRDTVQTRKGTKTDQESHALDPVTRSLGEGGVTDQESNQCGSNKPHHGPSDAFPGGGGELETRKVTKMDQVSPNWGNGSYSFVETSPEMLARC